MEFRLQGLELAKFRQKALFYGPDGSAYHDSFETDDFIDLGQSSFSRNGSVLSPIPVIIGGIIPDMSSNNQGVFAASASSVYGWSGGGSAWNAFDENPSTGWLNSSSTNPIVPAWLQIDLGATTAIGSYSIQSRHTYSVTYDGFPIDFQLRGSDDLVNWTLVDSQSGLSWTHGETKTFNATGNFRFYQLYVTQTNTGNVTINAFQLYPPSTPDPMEVVSKPIVAASVPNTVNFAVLVDGSVDIYASRDDGDTWEEATQASLYDNHDGFSVVSAVADVSGQPSDNEVRYKIEGTGSIDGLAMWCE